MYQKLYKYLNTPEENGKKIGLFRIMCAIFGGLILAYLFMATVSILLPFSLKHSMVVPLYSIGITWAVFALWISLSYTKLIALKRVIYPFLFFIFVIVIYWSI